MSSAVRAISSSSCRRAVLSRHQASAAEPRADRINHHFAYHAGPVVGNPMWSGVLPSTMNDCWPMRVEPQVFVDCAMELPAAPTVVAELRHSDGPDREKARQDRRSPFRRPDAAGRHRLAGDALSAGPREARLRGVVRRGWRRQSLRSARSTASRWNATTTSAICGASWSSYGLGGRWAYWDAINDVYHGLSRERVRALYAEADGADQSVRRDTAARGASAPARCAS